jgi:hypothetical protein
MNAEEKIIERLERHQTQAPDGFAERVMDALPEWSKPTLWDRLADFWPTHGRWIVPALAGAAASLLVVFGLSRGAGSPGAVQTAQVQTTIHFELHAPGADQVELLGSFNDWKTGDVVLTGPDASGHWTADVTLPEGRYEYIFLVDGERWMADPRGSLHRPDGFGHENTVIDVYENDNHA